MQPYLDFMRHVRDHGHRKDDRTGTGTLSVFGYQMRFDLAHGFPLLTTKRVHTKSIIHELLWFLHGDTNIAYLKANGVRSGTNGPTPTATSARSTAPSGAPGRRPTGRSIDQIANLVAEIKRNPDSRRLIVSAWNVGEIPRMKLPPCHAFFQFYVAGGRLSCQLYQRSADIFLGVPFNIASYALLTHMVAQQCDLEVGEFIWDGRRLPPLPQSPGTGGHAARARAVSAAPPRAQAASADALRLCVRRHRDRGLPASPGAEGARRRVALPGATHLARGFGGRAPLRPRIRQAKRSPPGGM